MNIIFMGTPGFAIPSLTAVNESKHELVSVVTVPDKKQGRGQSISYSDVKKFAIENNIEVLQPEDLSDINFINRLKALKPDIIVVVAFRILPEIIFDIPAYGIFNLHASLLPKYRGAAPINRAVMNGDTETGVTTFFLKKKVDTGNIILQYKINILPEDDAGSLHDRLSKLGADAVIKTIELIEKNDLTLIKQDDSLASKAPKIFKEDCLINWENDSVKIHNHIRGLSPYPAAFTHFNNKSIKIFKSILTDLRSENLPGEFRITGKKLYVNTKDNLLEISELQPEGKKRMTAKDFINGLNLT